MTNMCFKFVMVHPRLSTVISSKLWKSIRVTISMPKSTNNFSFYRYLAPEVRRLNHAATTRSTGHASHLIKLLRFEILLFVVT